MRKSSGFGETLRHLRQARGLRQREVAARLKVDPSQIPKWEREQQGIRLESLVAVLEALGVGMEEFGAVFDRARRGELLEQTDRSEEEPLVWQPEKANKASSGRLTVFLWEEGREAGVAKLAPEQQAEIDGVLRDVRHALDLLRPPEEREKVESDAEPVGALREREL